MSRLAFCYVLLAALPVAAQAGEDGPAETPGTYDHVRAALPEPGQWALLHGSEITAPTLVGKQEFPDCRQWRGCDGSKAFLSWTGMAWDETGGQWWQLAGGGQRDHGGNEIYRFSFSTGTWLRMWDPVVWTESADAPECRAPANGPVPSHSYDGSVYIPQTNEVLLLSNAPGCSKGGYGGRLAWAWSVSEKRWRNLAHLTDGSIRRFRYPKTAVDATRGVLYAMLDNELVTLDLASNDYAVLSIDNAYRSSSGSALFDDKSRRLVWLNRSDGIYRRRIGLGGLLGDRERLVRYTKEKPAPPNQMSSLALHTPTGELVQWDGGDLVYRTLPNGVQEALVPLDGPRPPETTRRVVYSKWVYLETLDVFLGIDDARDGVWLYRLPTSTR